jgi:hypothetical protein
MQLIKSIVAISGMLGLFLAAKVSASESETAQLWNDVKFDRFLRCTVIDQSHTKGRFKRGAEVEIAYNSTTGEIWALQRRIDIDNEKGGEMKGHGSTKLQQASVMSDFREILILTKDLDYETIITTLTLSIDRVQLTVEGAFTYWHKQSRYNEAMNGECVIVQPSEAFDWALINHKI